MAAEPPCLVVRTREDQADIICNECGGVIQTVPIGDVEAVMLELAQTDTVSSVQCPQSIPFPPSPGSATVLGQGTPGEEFMQSQALAMDWIFEPARWRPAGWLAEWLRHRAARQLERRQGTRQRVANLAAHYWDGTAAVSHVVRDVSTTGAFIFADFKWPPGTIVTLTLQLETHPALAPTLVRTKVVRSVPDGFGVQFLFLSKTERQSLADFLKGIAES
jgi:hypothetical protein